MAAFLLFFVFSQCSDSPTLPFPTPSDYPEFPYNDDYGDEYDDDYDGDWNPPENGPFFDEPDQGVPKDIRDDSTFEDVFEMAPWVEILKIVFFVALGLAGLGVGFVAARLCRGEAVRARVDADVDEPLILRVL
jgi:hypothetical protein